MIYINPFDDVVDAVEIKSAEDLHKEQVKQETKEKYDVYNRCITLASEKEKLVEANKILAEDLRQLDPVIRMLKSNEWSFDIDPDCSKKKLILSVLKEFDNAWQTISRMI